MILSSLSVATIEVIEAVLAFVIANPAKSDGWKQDADAKLAEGDA